MLQAQQLVCTLFRPFSMGKCAANKAQQLLQRVHLCLIPNECTSKRANPCTHCRYTVQVNSLQLHTTRACRQLSQLWFHQCQHSSFSFSCLYLASTSSVKSDKKVSNERSFPERSRKLCSVVVFFSSRMLTPFSFILTVAQKTKALPAAAASSLFHHFGCGFRKALLIPVSSRAHGKNRYHPSPVVPVFVSILASCGHPEFISWSQKSSVDLRPAVSKHLIGL